MSALDDVKVGVKYVRTGPMRLALESHRPGNLNGKIDEEPLL